MLCTWLRLAYWKTSLVGDSLGQQVLSLNEPSCPYTEVFFSRVTQLIQKIKSSLLPGQPVSKHKGVHQERDGQFLLLTFGLHPSHHSFAPHLVPPAPKTLWSGQRSLLSSPEQTCISSCGLPHTERQEGPLPPPSAEEQEIQASLSVTEITTRGMKISKTHYEEEGKGRK